MDRSLRLLAVMDGEIPRLSREADLAASSGDLVRAHKLLGEAAQRAGQDITLWLKYAALSRALGQLQEALEAVYRALEVAPLDFTALLLRASLLTAMNNERAGEAWGHALAQRPDGDLPPQVASAIAEGERRHAEWLGERERALIEAMAAAESLATADQRECLRRFRSNALRRTKPYHSNPTHFHYPGLREREFHPRESFPWLEELEEATEVIANELHALMSAQRAELAPYIQYQAHEPLDQWRELNNNPDWSAIHLWKNGVRVEANARQCPQTMALLEKFDQPRVRGASPNAMFSLLAPKTSIPAHVGVNNARLVCHLPLIVPEGCWFRVGAQTRYWRRGEAFVFDDTIEHEASNPSDLLRIVFIFDVWHPDLAEAEKAGVRALIEAEGSAGAGL